MGPRISVRKWKSDYGYAYANRIGQVIRTSGNYTDRMCCNAYGH
jgi:hypothetical protein